MPRIIAAGILFKAGSITGKRGRHETFKLWINNTAGLWSTLSQRNCINIRSDLVHRLCRRQTEGLFRAGIPQKASIGINVFPYRATESCGKQGENVKVVVFSANGGFCTGF